MELSFSIATQTGNRSLGLRADLSQGLHDFLADTDVSKQHDQCWHGFRCRRSEPTQALRGDPPATGIAALQVSCEARNGYVQRQGSSTVEQALSHRFVFRYHRMGN
ncbi:hypothetical protein CN155_08125 [Sinorhizobium meliloti]|uniref:hypothetical protein n=1 Tax=Rhizobium meliloti TaxID=382 RepID=UPI000FD8D9FF|nr:hypothetical protein [Sinorhizobium meliloti]RVK59239.1 hypothetical protein CN155_08125 [Sinorhizobium meliloti]